MPVCFLPNRGLISVLGPDAAPFLDNLLTVSIGALQKGEARYGALLTPQGKMIVDGLIVATDDGFAIDCPRALAGDLARRLGFYKLRAKVDIANRSDDWAVIVGWKDGLVPPDAVVSFIDPRYAALGWRSIIEAAHRPPLSDPEADYDSHRVALGIPEGGRDFIYGDAFPHEADMDQLHGVDFTKGCYVGQEVVSRMQHRGTARTRCVPIRFIDGMSVPEGADAIAGEKICGRIGSSSSNGSAIGLLRLDRVADALAIGEPLTANGHAFVLEKRDWIQFELTGAA
jgi:folate-binding protein YgfZ